MSGRTLDVVLCVSALTVALAARWPDLLLVPPFATTGGSVLLALDAAAGRSFPLVDQAPYIGAPFIWLLAAVYRLAGPSIEVTLLVPWLVGGLTVVPTYLLGREIGGRLVGALAATLLAVSVAHTVISSHVALSHSLTPFVVTVTLWLVARALARGDGRLLLQAGLGAGVSLQTHPTIAPLLLGAATAVMLRRPDWFRHRWPYLAVALAVLGYGTLLLYQVEAGFPVVADIEAKQGRYLHGEVDTGTGSGASAYIKDLGLLTASLSRLTSGALLEDPASVSPLTDLGTRVYPVLALGGIVIAAARGDRLLVPVVVLGVLLPPLFNDKYRPVLDGRYLMPLLPVLLVGGGLLLATTAASVRSLLDACTDRSAIGWATGSIVLLAALGLIATQQWTQLEQVYQTSVDDGASNLLYLQTIDQVIAARAPGEAVLFDAQLQEVKSLGGGFASINLQWLLTVSDIPVEIWHDQDSPESLVGRLVVLRRTTAEQLADRLTLRPLDGRRLDRRDEPNFRAYRVEER